MNHTVYYKEGATPVSGIDTISIWLHPDIINRPEHFHERGNNNSPVNLRYKKEFAYGFQFPIRTNYLIDIQAEAINPNSDILEQVLSIIIEYTKDNTIHHHHNVDLYTINNFFHENMDRLFALDALDFYFDLHSEDVRLRGKPNPAYPNTRYSSGNPSILKVYSRLMKLQQKRHVAYMDIDNMEYPTRIEFSLRRENCNYLNLRNLSGTYEYIFLGYLPFLARKWLNYRSEIVEVSSCDIDYAHHLRQIMAVAGRRIPRYDLLKTPKKPIPNNRIGRKEVDSNFIPGFYSIA